MKDKEIEQPNYYAIIPANVRYADIPANAKLLYGEITALCNQKGYCWATNKYFANIYSISERQISRLIGVLGDKKFIKITIIPSKKGQEVVRTLSITLTTKSSIPIDKNVYTPLDKNVYYNNTSINNKNNNTFSKEKKPFYMGKPMSKDLKFVIWGQNDLREFAGDKKDIKYK